MLFSLKYCIMKWIMGLLTFLFSFSLVILYTRNGHFRVHPKPNMSRTTAHVRELSISFYADI